MHLFVCSNSLSACPGALPQPQSRINQPFSHFHTKATDKILVPLYLEGQKQTSYFLKTAEQMNSRKIDSSGNLLSLAADAAGCAESASACWGYGEVCWGLGPWWTPRGRWCSLQKSQDGVLSLHSWSLLRNVLLGVKKAETENSSSPVLHLGSQSCARQKILLPYLPTQHVFAFSRQPPWRWWWASPAGETAPVSHCT